MERIFDRVVRFDERSRNYPATLGFEQAPLRSYSWNYSEPLWLDQGPDGMCVGFAWAHDLAARPVTMPSSYDLARSIYLDAQKIDEWEGEAYSGTSVLAGAKTVAAMLESDPEHEMRAYRWAFGIEDVVRVIGYKGPCVLGINWLADMMDTDENGFIHASGSIQGGHAILARNVKVVWRDKSQAHDFTNLDLEASYVTLRNSWGAEWGVSGDCKISVAELSSLLAQGGEACVPEIAKRES